MCPCWILRLCDVRGLAGYRVVEQIVMTSPDIKAVNTADAPHAVIPRRVPDAEVEDGRLTAVLPALSWNVIRLSKMAN